MTFRTFRSRCPPWRGTSDCRWRLRPDAHDYVENRSFVADIAAEKFNNRLCRRGDPKLYMTCVTPENDTAQGYHLLLLAVVREDLYLYKMSLDPVDMFKVLQKTNLKFFWTTSYLTTRKKIDMDCVIAGENLICGLKDHNRHPKKFDHFVPTLRHPKKTWYGTFRQIKNVSARNL